MLVRLLRPCTWQGLFLIPAGELGHVVAGSNPSHYRVQWPQIPWPVWVPCREVEAVPIM